MPIEHIITEYDTMLGIAQLYFGDSRRWKEIADYNLLDSPYIVVDPAEAGASYGAGYVQVTRDSASSSLLIRKGWTFTTKPQAVTNMVKVFTVTEDTTLPVGETTSYIYVQCTSPGVIGNVAPGAITELGDAFIQANIQFSSITNLETFTGGDARRVLSVGESIFIPTDADNVAYPPADIASTLDTLGGEDIALGSLGELSIDGYGDISSVSGIDNIKQAVFQRITAEKGEYALHPSYGTKLYELNGSAPTPYMEKLAQLYVIEEMANEDRIQDFEITTFETLNTSLLIGVTFKPLNTGRDVSIALKLNYSTLKGGH